LYEHIDAAKPCRKARAQVNKTHTVVVGGGVYEACTYSFDNIILGGCPIPRLIAFCADYTGTLRSNVLLGLNVLNNLDYAISRNKHSLSFGVDIWELMDD
jgi:hypothetical protein